MIPELSEHSVCSTAHLQLTNSVSKTSKTKVVANYSGMNYYVVKGSRGRRGGDPKGPKRERDKRGEREGERPILSCPEQQQQQTQPASK
jgi:hypothetical protein